MNTKRLLLVFLVYGCMACGSSGGRTSTDYTGIWDIVFNMLENDAVPSCNWFLAPGVQGFVDQQVVDPTEDGITLASASGLIEGPAVLEADGSLLAEGTIEGDLIGTGVPCQGLRSFRYSGLQDSSATVVFSDSITCTNGFVCEDRALGRATRRPV